MTRSSANLAAKPVIVGVDVGGSKIAAAVVDGQGRLTERVRCSTDVRHPEATLDSIAAAVEQAIQKSGYKREEVRAVGLGVPGLVDPVKGIGIASVNLSWQEVPVKAGLEARLGIPCSIENDVKAAALGEAYYGSGRGLDNLVYLAIGTGIAAAIVLHQKIYRGRRGMAGEIGHAIIEPNGPQCKCGGRGCFEALASGPAIASRAEEKLRDGRTSCLSARLSSGHRLTAEDVFSAAREGDNLANETVTEVAGYVAYVLQFMALAYDPCLIVLGGGVPQAGDVFMSPILKALDALAEQNWVFREWYTAGSVKLTELGADLGILGAAALVARCS